jgi:hypothetical protein
LLNFKRPRAIETKQTSLVGKKIAGSVILKASA